MMKMLPPGTLRRKQQQSSVNGRIAVKPGLTKTVKEIKVDIDKCTGGRACEIACSAYHATPRDSSINPSQARIRVVANEITDEYVPIRAGDYTPSECNGRHVYTIGGKEYSEGSVCVAACASSEFFVESGRDPPLKV